MLPDRVTRVLDMLFAPGRLDAGLRRAAAALAAKWGGGSRALEGTTELPEALRLWVDKVATNAYRCTDRDVAALVAAGYSEDQIFEITLAAAVGAGVSRFERGLALLKAGR